MVVCVSTALETSREVRVTAEHKTPRGPTGASRMRIEFSPCIGCRVVFPKLSIVEWTVVVPVSTQDIAFSIGCELGSGHPGLSGKIIELGPGIRRRIIGVEVLIDGQVTILGIAMAKANVSDTVNSEVERMVSVTPGEGRPD